MKGGKVILNPQEAIEAAERALPEPCIRKEKPKKRLVLFIFPVLTVVALIRVILWSTETVEPIYEIPAPDSASIIASAQMIEEHAVSTGSLPDGLEERISASPDVSLTVNSDGSFIYEENGFFYRSAPDILSSGGEQQ